MVEDKRNTWPARTTSPTYTTILTRRVQRKSNPWCQSEAAEDFALGHRYSCLCQNGEKLPDMIIPDHTTSMTGKTGKIARSDDS